MFSTHIHHEKSPAQQTVSLLSRPPGSITDTIFLGLFYARVVRLTGTRLPFPGAPAKERENVACRSYRMLRIKCNSFSEREQSTAQGPFWGRKISLVLPPHPLKCHPQYVRKTEQLANSKYFPFCSFYQEFGSLSYRNTHYDASKKIIPTKNFLFSLKKKVPN